MNKVASYLQGHIAGEVLVSDHIRKQFSTDASILAVKPSLVVYPRTTNDVRKVARFSWQLAEKGHALPVTARGNGTDLGGAAIGRGVVLAFPAHLNKILELDAKQKLVRVQPGVNFKSLQETLHTHGLFLPSFPASYEYSSIGGAIANNTSGIKAHKYGDMRSWVDRLEVVLANGEVIQTGPLTKKEVNKKLGLATLEGELYRAADAILHDGEAALEAYAKSLHVSKDNLGYALSQMKNKSGLDLTPLFVGSQGTLGIITEAILKVTAYSPVTTLVVAAFSNIDDAVDAAEKIEGLRPSVLELVEGDVFAFVEKHNNIVLPDELKVDGSTPAAVVFAECDDPTERVRKKFAKNATKIVSAVTESYKVSSDFDELEKLWSYRYVTSSFMTHETGGVCAVPIVEDAAIPYKALSQMLPAIKELGKKHHVQSAVWVHAAACTVHVLPLIDISKLGDRQRVFRLMDDYYKLVVKLGGSVAAEHGTGRIRAPYVTSQVGEEVAGLYETLRKAADPHGTLNPGVKTGTTVKDLVDMMRSDYSFSTFAEYLPRM